MVAFVARKKLKLILISIIACSLGYKILLAVNGGSYAEIFRPLIGCGDSLSIGALVALLSAEIDPREARVTSAPVLFGLSLMFIVAWTVRAYATIDFFFTGRLLFGVVLFFYSAVTFGYVILFLFERPSGYCSQGLSLKSFAYIARISYGLYLYHFFLHPLAGILITIGVLEIRWNPAVAGWIATVAAFVVATISWYCVEAPLLRLKQRINYISKKPQIALGGKGSM